MEILFQDFDAAKVDNTGSEKFSNHCDVLHFSSSK